MENIDDFKRSRKGSPRYLLKDATVFVSPGGYHYIEYLDPPVDPSSRIDPSNITDETIDYIEESLQANAEKFDNQVRIVKKYTSVEKTTALDIGCGGGLFLSKLKNEGAKVTGIELNDSRVHYASTKHELEVHMHPIESDYWQDGFSGNFDIVTLWDVIEHVNYPLLTLRSSSRVLKKGGLLFIDTPCRDGFYHRFGELTYRLSRGKCPTFLNVMYSTQHFGHKQIFSTSEIKALFEQAGIEVLEFKKFHELSFPYRFYLKKMFRSEKLVTLILPLVNLFFLVFPVRNKMLLVGRKK